MFETVKMYKQTLEDTLKNFFTGKMLSDQAFRVIGLFICKFMPIYGMS